MVLMRWVITLGLIAGCGRIAFDPRDDGDGGSNGTDANGVADDSATDSGTPPPSSHYVAGGSTSQSGPATSISTNTGPLAATNMVLVVAIHWRNATSSVSTVQDTSGNGFSMVGSMI